MTISQKEVAASRVWVAIAWAAVLAATIAAYWKGLGGPFLFDDFGSIAAMGNYGGVTDWETFKQFVFRGHAGPTGRPLSLATFLVDGTNWPTEPWPFKRTNLVIHLLCGTVLAILTYQVLRIVGAGRRHARWVALVTAGAWLLHPFLVSTTLYVVQRMAQLATLFVFAGLVGYLYGRTRVATDGLRAYAFMSVSLVLGTALALLSKENGALLPLLAGVFEITIVAASTRYRGQLARAWVVTFLVLPSILIATYLAHTAISQDFFAIRPPRDFSLYERMLTQPRILADYLYNWFIPKLYTTGVFQDHFIKSTGLLSPITTLLAIVLHVGLAGVALLRRRDWPLFSLAVLFFYGGHLVESTVINLELYFEHRNYLPAAFLFLPLAEWAMRKLDTRVFWVAACATLLLLGGFTRFAATIWQDYSMIVAASARKAPTSARAQGQYAMELFNSGNYDESIAVVDEALKTIPGRHSLLLVMRLNILCAGGNLNRSDFRQTAAELSKQYYDPRLIHAYSTLVAAVVEGKCASVQIADLSNMFHSMLEESSNSNPASLGYSHLQYFLGQTAIFMGDRDRAMSAFLASLESRPGASHAMMMAALMATGGYFEEALQIADLASAQIEADRRSTINGNRVSEADIRHFQDVVRADLAAQQATGKGGSGQ
jgi:tetratricopeptide (TPR) repeat protein